MKSKTAPVIDYEVSLYRKICAVIRSTRRLAPKKPQKKIEIEHVDHLNFGFLGFLKH